MLIFFCNHKKLFTEDILVQEHFQSGNLTSCSKIPHCVAVIHLGDILTQGSNVPSRQSLSLECTVATSCTLCMRYQFGRLSINRNWLLPNSFCEVPFSIVNEKHSFVQVGTYMFTENFDSVMIWGWVYTRIADNSYVIPKKIFKKSNDHAVDWDRKLSIPVPSLWSPAAWPWFPCL